ncbi:GNAT family N-acetyltransferase [Rhodovulum sulfidophilum]|uniref:GNAT family N-acetyltransferase n=1 Tax=Rhodovulum sulfidophilum TaxID=35806 RepID=UPI000951CC4E|nr:GNAT family N-acetyltransferase [Rhodovulum sulfidophilum]OLS50820.1 GNAT family N-acetyltransferase [Rhodovulum sulfidophilum]
MTNQPAPPAPLTLGDCTQADLPGVQAIYAEAVRTGTASFELAPPDLSEMRARWEKVTEAGFPWLVARAGNRVAGYAYANTYRQRPAYRGTVENSVYVDAAFRGQGVGRALLGALLARCEAAGFRQMVAVIGDSQNTGSIALHRALGFRDAGVLRSVGWKHGRWLDSVEMQKPLGPGDTTPFDGLPGDRPQGQHSGGAGPDDPPNRP